MPDTPHVLSSFDEALRKVQNDLLLMTTLAQRSLENISRSLLEGDIEACNAVIADDDEIDRLEVAVGQDGTEVLMRFQPVAKDLRQVVSAMRLCGDIERVGDQAVNIARKLRKLDAHRIATYRGKLSEMLSEAASLFTDSVASYQNGDLPLAHGIKERDRHLDELNGEITELATAEIAENPSEVSTHLAIILIARHLERVGDYSKNIAENAIYAVSDEDLRHRSRPGL